MFCSQGLKRPRESGEVPFLNLAQKSNKNPSISCLWRIGNTPLYSQQTGNRESGLVYREAKIKTQVLGSALRGQVRGQQLFQSNCPKDPEDEAQRSPDVPTQINSVPGAPQTSHEAICSTNIDKCVTSCVPKLNVSTELYSIRLAFHTASWVKPPSGKCIYIYVYVLLQTCNSCTLDIYALPARLTLLLPYGKYFLWEQKMGSKNPWTVENASGFCAIKLTQQMQNCGS